jgi:hypothetical protein
MAASADMTRAEALAMTIERCDAMLEEQLAAAELLLIDLNATGEEIECAIGRDGYMRKMMQADRDAQVAAVRRWLTLGAERVH